MNKLNNNHNFEANIYKNLLYYYLSFVQNILFYYLLI